MNKIPCEIIQDLLPSYIDQLTSDKTNATVEEHIKECPACEQMLKKMRGNVEQSFLPDQKDEKEIRFLEKNIKRNQQIALWSIFGTLLLFGIFLTLRFFIVGNNCNEKNLALDYFHVENGVITLQASTLDSARVISNAKFEEKDGIVTITPKSVLVSPLNQPGKQFSYTIQSDSVNQVRIGDRILWANGQNISELASDLYATKHPYIGDMPANGRTALAFGLQDLLDGPYTNELETKEEPYGWIIRPSKDIPEVKSDIRQWQMTRAAYMFLALIGNLDHVTYEFTVDGKPAALTITAEEASFFLGQDIKSCSNDISLLETLIQNTK